MKTTEKMKALELSRLKITMYVALISLMSTFMDTLIKMFEKNLSQKWRVLACVLGITLFVVLFESYKIITKKQQQIDYLMGELDMKNKLEKIRKQSKE